MPAASRRLDQRVAHRVRVLVQPAAGRVVQVVELADRGDAGQRHLGEHRRWPAPGRSPDRARRRPRTSARARSRTCRHPPGCGRAAPGGRRASARSPGPARSARSASRRRPGGGVTPQVDRGRSGPRPPRSAPALDPPPIQASSRQKRPGPAGSAGSGFLDSQGKSPASSCNTSASAGTPARQSAVVRVLAGRVGDAGGVAHEQHRGRYGRRQDAGVVPRAGRQHRDGAETLTESARQTVPQSVVEFDDRRERLPFRTQGGAVPAGPLVRGLDDLLGQRRPGSPRRGARPSSQARTRDGMALVPLGSTTQPAERGQRPAELGLLAAPPARWRRR